MGVPFEPVPDVAALDALLGQSAATPVVLFNHDRYCPLSRQAERALRSLTGPIAVIDVTRQHDLKRAVAKRTGVAHESPQVIVVRDGRAVWSAAHFAITADAVTQAVTVAQGQRYPEGRPAAPEAASVPAVVVVAGPAAPEAPHATGTTSAAHRPVQGLWRRLSRAWRGK